MRFLHERHRSFWYSLNVRYLMFILGHVGRMQLLILGYTNMFHSYSRNLWQSHHDPFLGASLSSCIGQCYLDNKASGLRIWIRSCREIRHVPLDYDLIPHLALMSKFFHRNPLEKRQGTSPGTTSVQMSPWLICCHQFVMSPRGSHGSQMFLSTLGDNSCQLTTKCHTSRLVQFEGSMSM